MRLNFSVLMVSAVIAIMMTASGCSSMNRGLKKLTKSLGLIEHVAPEPPPKDASDEYKKAYALLEAEKFSEALAKFDEFLQNDPVSPWTQAANLNAGRALEGLERWDEAAKRYRGIAGATQSAPRLQAMALYRSSFCYEALGDEQQAVAVLNDLLSRKRFLSDEIANAELPARLGAVYARVGNFDRAVELYRQAEAGIGRLRQAEKGKIPAWLPRTLYFMGEMSRLNFGWDDFTTALRPLARSQVYLMQAAELDQAPWADRAAKELVAIYRNLIQVIENAPASMDGDPLLVERERQRQQWDRAVLILDTMAQLRARAVPGAEKDSAVGEILSALSEVEKRVQDLLLERPAGEGLTREALARKGTALPRVLETGDHALEERFLESSRQDLPVKPIKRSEDPNL